MVSTLEGGPSIARVMDLQIVNGGQTTASIATAARDPQVDMENVCVQMKLVVVEPDLLDELVPNISRFANRQNAVQDSDLAANNDYLRQLQIVSRTEWTPSSSSGRASKWYFERARGSYAVEKAEAGTPSQQAIFLSNYPTNQHFGKNELAIYENTWARLPQFVCRGGQKNFAEFVDRLTEIPTGDDSGAEEYRRIFRNLVSKAILFKSADKLIYKSLGGTYKRAVVTYTVSYLIEHSAIGPDLDQIWRTQKIESQVESAIVEIAGPLKDFLILSAAGRNITEWAKNKDCWEAIRGESFPFSDPFTQSAGSPSAGPTPSDGAADTERRSANTGEVGMSLADAIEAVLGERIEGDWKANIQDPV